MLKGTCNVNRYKLTWCGIHGSRLYFNIVNLILYRYSSDSKLFLSPLINVV